MGTTTNVTVVNTLINGTTAYGCYGVFAHGKAELVGGYLPCYEPTADQPFVPCCGSDSYCMSDNYCYGKSGNTLGTYRYYIAACTDPTYSDTAACSTHCKGQYSDTVWYDNVAKEWECCNWDNLTGTDPTNSQCTLPEGDERWATPAQSMLVKLGFVGNDTAASTTITASSGMTVAYSTSASSSSSHSLSTTSTSVSAFATSSGSGSGSASGSSSASASSSSSSSSKSAGTKVGAGAALRGALVFAVFALLL